MTSHPAAGPVTRRLSALFAVSALITVLMSAASLAGLLFPARVYPDPDLYQTFAPNDFVNLVIGLPILLLAMWFARRGRLVGLLLWPGALLFVLYNYLIYSFAGPFHWLYMVYLALVALSLYSLPALLASLDAALITDRLAGRVPEKLAGGVLVILGGLFLLRAAGVLVSALIAHSPLPATEVALNTTDFLIAPTWIITGVLLWQRTPFGYVAGLGTLYSISMLFIGLIMFMLLQPVFASAAPAWIDIGVVFLMGLVCFVPFVLYLRGVLSRSS
jgi:hypothetical protein